MKNKLSIIIAHYFPKESDYDNPLQKTIEEIEKQLLGNEVEIIIADDGSSYTNQIINDYTKKIEINNDSRDIYMLEGEKLKVMLNSINLNSSIIKRWIYLPKFIHHLFLVQLKMPLVATLQYLIVSFFSYPLFVFLIIFFF